MSYGEKVLYLGVSKEQLLSCAGDDPSEDLVYGQTYTVGREEVHSWHTLLFLAEFPGKGFNSCYFKLLKNM